MFHKLLRDYEPQPADFLQETVELQGEQVPANKPPGYDIMFHLLNDSPALSLCLSLLEEGVRQLDTYAPFPGQFITNNHLYVIYWICCFGCVEK